MYIYLPIAEISMHIGTIFGLGGGVGFLSGLFGVGGGFLMAKGASRCRVPITVVPGNLKDEQLDALF